ncbi:MAG TPA: hypothetical protein VIJ14_04140 [Rhabdochlamydiaceae bacterium]
MKKRLDIMKSESGALIEQTKHQLTMSDTLKAIRDQPKSDKFNTYFIGFNACFENMSRTHCPSAHLTQALELLERCERVISDQAQPLRSEIKAFKDQIEGSK